MRKTWYAAIGTAAVSLVAAPIALRRDARTPAASASHPFKDFGWSHIPATGDGVNASAVVDASVVVVRLQKDDVVEQVVATATASTDSPRAVVEGESVRLAFISRGVSGEAFGSAGTISHGYEIVGVAGDVRASWRRTLLVRELDRKYAALVSAMDARAREAVLSAIGKK